MRKGKCTHCPHPHREPGPGYPGLSGTYKYSNWLLYGIYDHFFQDPSLAATFTAWAGNFRRTLPQLSPLSGV
jgi:hypothetical protein